MTKSQKNEIMSIPFSRLLKLEVPQLAEKLIVILEKYDPEVLKFSEMNDLFLAQKPNIDAMTVPYKGHEITPKLKRLRAKLNLEVRSIKLKLELVIKNDPTGEDSQVLVLRTEIPRFLEKFSDSENEEIKHRKVVQFSNEVTVNAALQTAMDTHGFLSHLDEMISTLNLITEHLGERLASISKRPKVKTPELTKLVTKAMLNVTQEINLQQLKNPTLDYSELIDEVNQQFIKYRTLMNIRKANNERKALGLPPIEKGETEASRMFMAPTNGSFAPEVGMRSTNVNGSGEDFDQSLDQKKAVAPSTKQTQLPSSKNEDLNTNTLN